MSSIFFFFFFFFVCVCSFLFRYNAVFGKLFYVTQPLSGVLEGLCSSFLAFPVYLHIYHCVLIIQYSNRHAEDELVARKTLFGLSSESIFQCACPVLWLKYSLGLSPYWAKNIDSGESARMRSLAWIFVVRICNSNLFPLTRPDSFTWEFFNARSESETEETYSQCDVNGLPPSMLEHCVIIRYFIA